MGKRLPNALYVHKSALTALDPRLQSYERSVRGVTEETQQANLVKFTIEPPKISYLFYPDFDINPHPALQSSIIVDPVTKEYTYRDYSTSDNPPILHRKETFVTPDYPLYEEFATLTRWEEALGLLDNGYYIGRRQEWKKLLVQQRIDLEGHSFICPLDLQRKIVIQRHKAAIVRQELSRPVTLALNAGLFTPGISFFDYGCGYGGDVKRIGDRGYASSGWDPYYRPHTHPTPADIVNLGYVINVIEDLAQRREALLQAWELTRQVLIVAALVSIYHHDGTWCAYGDGIITQRNTFQKYYQQEELKHYIDSVLNVDAIPAGLGIYFAFRDGSAAQTFRANSYHSRVSTPKVQKKVRLFEDYAPMLAPLMAFFTLRGRLPIKGELPEEKEIKEEFGNFRNAFKLILEATDEAEWEAIATKRSEDLSIYLALSNFNVSGRPTMRKLPPPVREDIRALCGNYKRACAVADLMLLSLRDLEEIGEICQQSTVGQKRKHDFRVHISALKALDPLLRLYEGCASRIIGRLEEANIIQFSLQKPQISYHYYPDFDTLAHPILRTTMSINLGDLQGLGVP